jgi:hypothetical protein
MPNNASKATQPGNRLAAAPNAPSVFVPMRFMVAGLLSLFLIPVLVWLRPATLATYHYNQHVIALTHLAVLGWVCTIVMGAVYQLVPVALETRLHSERMAKWQFAFHLAGFAGMVWMFWRWDMKQVGHFGSALAVGAGLFIYNIARTLARAPRWTVISAAIASALFWLGLAMLVGLSVAAGKCSYDFETPLAQTGVMRTMLHGLQSAGAFMGKFDQFGAMHAHAHLGSLGCFVMLIVGVSYRLVPMFAISELQNARRALWSVILLNVGLAGAFVTILLRSPWKLAFAGVIAAALLLYALELRAILKARKRRTLDWGIRYFVTGLCLLIPVALLGVVLSWPTLPLTSFTGQLENLYGFLGIMGVLSLAIMGMLYKVVPFLVWFGRYSSLVGRYKVPTLADLYSPRLQVIGYWTYLSALAVLAGGIVLASEPLVRAGACVLAGSLAVLAVNMGNVFRHLANPRIESVKLQSFVKATV